jgi:D-beta-D-heptose 7-phosphate kinase/D-beta-D-heptose 1-phosphate adenosyltransferase
MPERQRLTEIVEAFKNKRIAVVGDSMVDVYIHLELSERINPEAHAPLYDVRNVNLSLGGAGNTAANFASLEANVDLYGCKGDDAYGSWMGNECLRLGIGSFLHTCSFPTIIKTREFVHGKYDRRHDCEVVGNLDSERVCVFTNLILSEDYDGIVISDYNKRMFRSSLGQALVEGARKKGIPTFVDPKPSNAPCFAGATLIRPNKKEAIELVGECADSREIVRRLHEKIVSDYTVVTLGGEGMISYDGKNIISVPADSNSPINFVGAGDTVLAGLSLALLSGASLEEAVWISSYAAGVVVEKPGTSTITSSELLVRISR